jgi:pimeloyl-ACP methyl ester carboxylesterase
MDWREFQFRQRVLELGDRFISYIDEGEGGAVVLLHGIPTWSYLWRDTVTQLSKMQRVLAPDLLGFGYSDKSDCFDRSIARQVEMVAAWMEKLGVRSAHFIAHDIGGGVALRMAVFDKQRVQRLTLMNTVCYDSWPVEAMLQWGHPETYRKLAASRAVTLLRQALKQGFASDPEEAWLEGLLSPYTTEVGKLSLIRNAAALNTNLTTEITPLLSTIDVPTMVLWGEADPFQPVKFGERLASDIPGARFIPVKDARHFVMIDKPDEVAGYLMTS